VKVLTEHEARIFACLTDTVLAPAPPLPPVHETDAVEAFDAWLAAAPAVNRAAMRALLRALGARLLRLAPARRLPFLRRVEKRLPLIEPLRGAAALSYYGDRRVQRLIGYVP
jgi:hypothetical protein